MKKQIWRKRSTTRPT